MDNLEEPQAQTQEPNPEQEQEQERTGSANDIVNVSHLLRKMARIQPYKRAVVFPAGWDETGRVAYTQLTFQQLNQESDCLAHGLEQMGVRRGTRTVLMVRPVLEFFTLTFALFKIGAVPVMVDPGMGIKRMVRCLSETRPEAFIGIPKAHFMRFVYPRYFKTVNTWITVGKRLLWGGHSLSDIPLEPWRHYEIAETQRDETAAILFTTGSTGPAKGVVYTHGMFDAQVRFIKSHFLITMNEVDLPTFPLFALFDPALGMTAIIPDMDFTRPAFADPDKIIEAITHQGVTSMFASPALLKRLGDHHKTNPVKLPSLKRVISAGAPVAPAVIETFSGMLPDDAEIHTPYGATEAMPVLSISGTEILNETRQFTEQGFGICVGRPLKDINVKIIDITDDPIPEWSDDLILPDGDIGEITASGEIVSRQYYEKPKDDSFAKIRDGETIRHRMGDLGWMDNKGRIWYCGRKSHRVITPAGTLYTIPCEALFNNHAEVRRSALVGVGEPPHQKPVICIELEHNDQATNKDQLHKELLNLAARHEMTKDIRTILFYDKLFPVDIRHNAKIFREQLALWAKQAGV